MSQQSRTHLTIRLARSEAEIKIAQRLRYAVFVQELGAMPDSMNAQDRLDTDRFDAHCDHLLVIDQKAERSHADTALEDGVLVGTYRLLPHERAQACGGFYSEGEFDLRKVLNTHQNLRFLEVGRSCVAASHRGKAVAELLWQGIWDYVRNNKLDVMMGCASLQGTNPAALAQELSFLHHYASAPAEWHAPALPHLRVDMNMLSEAAIDKRAVTRNLPILIKAYLRLGAFIGDGAVIDHAFNTTDVLILLPVSRINPKYFEHYGAPAQ
jgi:L-ornithine Nalpha-acyltransferase